MPHIQDFADRLLHAPKTSWMTRLGFARKSPQSIKGLYLWGSVGRGKTMLMDMLIQEIQKGDDDALPVVWRLHFNQLMDWVHTTMTQLKHTQDPLIQLAQRIAQRCRLLCIDEFFVEDIGDAMILGRLLRILLDDSSVVLFATSNTAPVNLYQDGLQRERFLPAIAMLERTSEVVEILSGEDWRLTGAQLQDRWIVWADPERAQASFGRQIEALGQGHSHSQDIEVRGRLLHGAVAGQAVWFDCDEICGRATGYRDYILLAERFKALGIRNLPLLGVHEEDIARRFMALVDQLYTCQVPLVVSAVAAPEEIYSGRLLVKSFARTKSRIEEMRRAPWPEEVASEAD